MASSTNPERETRILDAAADLIVQYGYDKTTVSDMARRAGVSKGTIYLHFDSKEDLFERLLLREMMAYSDAWLARIEADPEGGTFAGMYKNMLYALDETPFMAAMLKQDRHVFGSYLRKPNSLLRKYKERQRPSPRRRFVEMMQEAGAVRRDLDPAVTAHIMDMLAYGLVAIEEVKPEETIPPLEEVIEGIADLMERALTPEDGGDPEAGKVIIQQLAEGARQQFEQMRESEEEVSE